MKKLTAGIFATILGLTAVDAFAAVPTGKYNVASVKYVDEAMKAAQTAATYDDTEVRGLISAADAKGAQGITDAAAALAAAQAADAKAVAADGKAVAAQNDVDTLEGKVGTVAEGKTVVQMIEDAQTAASYDDTEVRGLISAADAKGAQGITDAAAAKAAADAAQAAAEAADAKAVAADGKAVAAQNDVDTLEGKVGTVAEGKTVVQMIEDAQTAASYDDTEVRGLISAADAKGAQGITDAAAAKAAADAAQAAADAADAKAVAAQGEVDALETNVADNYVAWTDVDDTYVENEYTF